mmetsp:Transcript_7931/g.16797  ORF Transcript_7931/g.16797 Transcript_7931/m.16797 type:complete len:224 (+) Transcript_7931:293-964(+)
MVGDLPLSLMGMVEGVSVRTFARNFMSSSASILLKLNTITKSCQGMFQMKRTETTSTIVILVMILMQSHCPCALTPSTQGWLQYVLPLMNWIVKSASTMTCNTKVAQLSQLFSTRIKMVLEPFCQPMWVIVELCSVAVGGLLISPVTTNLTTKERRPGSLPWGKQLSGTTTARFTVFGICPSPEPLGTALPSQQSVGMWKLSAFLLRMVGMNSLSLHQMGCGM